MLVSVSGWKMLLKGFFYVVLEIAKYSKIFDFHSQFAALLFLSSFIVVLGFAGAKRLAFSSSLSLIREC